MKRSRRFPVFPRNGRLIGVVAAIVPVLGTMVLLVSTPATAATAPTATPRSRLPAVPDPALVAASGGGAARSRAGAPASNGGWTQVNEFTGANDSGLGWAVAISGTTMVVGAPFDHSDIGAAYVYTGSGTHWTEVDELTPSDGVANDRFGVSVAIKGGEIVVGAECHSSSAPSCEGAAYVFTGSGGSWTQQIELDDPGQATNDYFGWPVSIAGKSILVSATGEQSAEGAVFVYALQSKHWTESSQIADPAGVAGDLFGVGASARRKSLIVGAPGTDGSAGAAYVFTRGSSGWTKTATLTASNGRGCSSTCSNGLGYVYGDYFGDAVALKGTTIVVGAPYASVTPAPDGVGTGTAYVFTRSGGVWTQDSELSVPAEVSTGLEDNFGFQVALAGSSVVATAPYDYRGANNYANGAAFVFPKEGSNWPDSSPDELVATDGVSGDYFGWSGLATIGKGIIVVGSPYSADGGLYFFQN